MHRYPFKNNNGCQIYFILLPNLLVWTEIIIFKSWWHTSRTAFLAYSIHTSAIQWRWVVSKRRASPVAGPVRPTTGIWLRTLRIFLKNDRGWVPFLLFTPSCSPLRGQHFNSSSHHNCQLHHHHWQPLPHPFTSFKKRFYSLVMFFFLFFVLFCFSREQTYPVIVDVTVGCLINFLNALRYSKSPGGTQYKRPYRDYTCGVYWFARRPRTWNACSTKIIVITGLTSELLPQELLPGDDMFISQPYNLSFQQLYGS